MANELILIVEDNPQSLKLVRDILQVKGYQTIESETGEEGVRLACERHPALILMDTQLPGINGIEALQRLRADPVTSSTPVIAVTASVIRGDERKVRQVVLNLLSNAIKFTPEGGRVEAAAVPKDGVIEVSVSDTGVGIAPEDQEAVFEEFRQVGTVDKKVEGTGLGLTLCRKFVELHGGKIWVKSQVGEGSTFTFTIPVRRGE